MTLFLALVAVFAVYLVGAINQQRQALAWERRPGRARDKHEPAARCRWEARLCAAGAEIEQLRLHAGEQAQTLPDLRGLLVGLHNESAINALIALYTTAATGR
jgi:hypothetical protein